MTTGPPRPPPSPDAETMPTLSRKTQCRPLLTVGRAILWGLIELVALNRYRRH